MRKTGQAALCFFLLSLTRFVAGQDVAAAKGPAFYSAFSLPDVAGTMHFSLSASDIYSLGYNATNVNSNSLGFSGSAAYLSVSPKNPFSLVYSGGYSPSTTGQPTQVVSNLALSQVVTTQRWSFTVADSVNYLPQTATAGLSGIPGLGDANVPPVTTGSDENLGILTNYAQRISNSISGTTTRQLPGALHLSLTASQSMNRFLNVPGGSTNDSNAYSVSTGLQRQLDARTSTGVQYSYSKFGTVGQSFSTQSQALTVNVSRNLTRRMTASGSVGPQFSTSSNPAIIPSHTSFSSSASFNYTASFASLGVNYSHGTSNSNGLTLGGESTTIGASASKSFEQSLSVSGHVGFSETNSLQSGALNTKAVVFSGQANRSLMRYLSIYVSYSASRQLSSGNAVSPLVLNGVTQTLAFGVTYSPAAIHLGH